ncbi:MAG: NusG domain II-containing protein [Clostridiales bacterium]|nr:NusG domain II-containing protein [Clostridiales bacterium]
MKLLKPLDFAAAAIVAAMAVAAALPGLTHTDPATLAAAVTTDSGVITLPLDLDNSYEINSHGHTLVIHIDGGTLSVTEADCPDRLCMKAGKISRAGQTIICVPARVLIEIKGGEPIADIIAG